MNNPNETMKPSNASAIFALTKNFNLSSLLDAQEGLDLAGQIMSDIATEEFSPNECEPALESFHMHLGECGRCIEKLMGAVVYNDLCAFKNKGTTQIHERSQG